MAAGGVVPSVDLLDIGGAASAPTTTTMRSAKVWCGTYNVNGKKEKALPLSWWLMCGWEDGSPAPDLFVISLQEMIDLSAANVVKEAVADTTSSAAAEEWAREFGRAFAYVGAKRPTAFPFAPPALVAEAHMVGVALFVFAALPPGVDAAGPQTARIPTGAVGGRLGNKGACVARFDLKSSSLCFVGAHLSAHRGDVAGRNADYGAIVSAECFRRDCGAPATAGGGARPSEPANALRATFGVLDHDLVFFLGDLNYRIDAALRDDAVRYLARSNLRKLLLSDQLGAERRAGRSFDRGFLEAPVAFLPTYKYVTGSALYDYEAVDEGNDKGKKVRCPAWCDRVLWRTAPSGPRPDDPALTEAATCVAYDRADDRLCVSDHRAVYALFDVRYRDVDGDGRVRAGAGEKGGLPTLPSTLECFAILCFAARRDPGRERESQSPETGPRRAATDREGSLQR